jgi:uncharacterized protein (DUF2164 family)
MAKITVEMNLDDDLVEDLLDNLKSVNSLLTSIDDMAKDMSSMMGAVGYNQGQIKDLSTSVQKLLAELEQNGSNTRKEG